MLQFLWIGGRLISDPVLSFWEQLSIAPSAAFLSDSEDLDTALDFYLPSIASAKDSRLLVCQGAVFLPLGFFYGEIALPTVFFLTSWLFCFIIFIDFELFFVEDILLKKPARLVFFLTKARSLFTMESTCYLANSRVYIDTPTSDSEALFLSKARLEVMRRLYSSFFVLFLLLEVNETVYCWNNFWLLAPFWW